MLRIIITIITKYLELICAHWAWFMFIWLIIYYGFLSRLFNSFTINLPPWLGSFWMNHKVKIMSQFFLFRVTGYNVSFVLSFFFDKPTYYLVIGKFLEIIWTLKHGFLLQFCTSTLVPCGYIYVHIHSERKKKKRQCGTNNQSVLRFIWS